MEICLELPRFAANRNQQIVRYVLCITFAKKFYFLFMILEFKVQITEQVDKFIIKDTSKERVVQNVL